MSVISEELVIDPREGNREAQHNHILSLLKIGDAQASLRQYREATLTYYKIFEPGAHGQSSLGLQRVAPLELYETAASKLRVVATQYAEKLVECGCFLAGESHDGIIGVPRGALNLYLISNQYEVFTRHALRYAAEEQSKRDIKRFLVSSVRARLNHLRSVDACATLMSEEKEAFDVLADFEVGLRAHLAPQRLAPHQPADTMCM